MLTLYLSLYFLKWKHIDPSASIKPERYLTSVSVNFILAPLRANPSFWFAFTSQLFRICYHTKSDVEGIARTEVAYVTVEALREKAIVQVHQNEI